jgi:Family of unknown function (DUF6174)
MRCSRGGAGRPGAARAVWLPLTGLMAFALVGTGCHRAVPARENVPVSENLPRDTGSTRTFNLQTPDQRDSLHLEIGRHREMWRAGGVQDYDFQLRISCFCPGQEGWVLVEVRRGQAVRANQYSLDGLFDLLKRHADHDDVVAVGFDDRWHYPRHISTDRRVGLPDDWGLYEVRGFTPR